MALYTKNGRILKPRACVDTTNSNDETRHMQRAFLPVSRPPRDTSYAAPLSACLTSPSLTQTWKYRTGILSDSAPVYRLCLSDVTIAYTNLEISNWSSQCQLGRPPRAIKNYCFENVKCR
ncbi:hypothetical protein J6590_088077 [Homalodisca vitripennis]|nr:hypothetical protein J6590_088077 [Homalodisca vitripennis]